VISPAQNGRIIKKSYGGNSYLAKIFKSENAIKYRPDIDGLRAISVIAVIFFHSGVKIFSGGYIGVDIFFVISGYLITTLVFDEIKSGTFSYRNFYKRRIARLLPALNITLFIVLLFGFIFYDNGAFDNLGKEIFFSSIGAANILFGQGVNYFAQNESIRPLIHLWSLGVEEQFYLVWPTILILLASLRLKNILLVVVVLFSISLYLSIASGEVSPIKTYFYPQYRAFELIVGVFTALWMRNQYYNELRINKIIKTTIALTSMVLIVAPMFLLEKNSTFLGLKVLWPCIGTSLFIAFSNQTIVSKAIGFSPLVSLGLISYPLYLYHQPIISYLQFFELASSNILTILVVLFVSIPLSWLTYIYVEKPIRSLAHKKDKSSITYVMLLTIGLAVLGVIGILVAKNNGFGFRFQILNPFAYQIAIHNSTTFHSNYKRGLNISDTISQGKILFIGDSVLQQYVYPFINALNIDSKEVDTVTRGGCVLLKNVLFQEQFSDISCNNLRQELYENNKSYDYIVISQDWNFYDDQILNFATKTPLKKWQPFIEETIEHFKNFSKKIVIIGSHPNVEGTSGLKPTIFQNEKRYRSKLNDLKIQNFKEMVASRSFFEQWHSPDSVIVIHPIDIWHDDVLHDGKWSFFSDPQHLSSASNEYVVKRLIHIFQEFRMQP
jgi:peptidoglycan/LPS O-acetylase OafA/YrhL